MEFVAQLGGTVHLGCGRGLEALKRSRTADVDTDSRSVMAGLLISIQKFIRRGARQSRIELPAQFGLGMVLFPAGRKDRRDIKRMQRLGCMLGWRTVPTGSSIVGPRAERSRGRQPFTPLRDSAQFEAHFQLAKWRPCSAEFLFAVLNTMVYKGLLTPRLPAFHPDLADRNLKPRDFISAIRLTL